MAAVYAMQAIRTDKYTGLESNKAIIDENQLCILKQFIS